MTTLIINRLGIIIIVFLVGLLTYRLYWLRISQHANNQEVLTGRQPTLLYFSSPDCTICHTVQTPTIRNLQAQLSEKIKIIEIDTIEQPKLAQNWSILSVPTIVILNAKGELASIKHGAQSQKMLLTEITPLILS